MPSIGACILEDKPRIALALGDGVSRMAVEDALQRGADLIELRVDHFSSFTPEYVCAQCARFAGIPILGTIRSRDEGGKWSHDEAARLALFKAIIPHTDALDVEVKAAPLVAEVVKTAKEAGKTVIGSFHDFEKTPDAPALNALIEMAGDLGVDIIKIAACCQSNEDLRVLARVLLDHGDKNLIVIGMGAFGLSSRIFFPALGSLLVYTFLGAPTAPGQLTLEETVHWLNLFHGTRGTG